MTLSGCVVHSMLAGAREAWGLGPHPVEVRTFVSTGLIVVESVADSQCVPIQSTRLLQTGTAHMHEHC